jgi:hypothetical protein
LHISVCLALILLSASACAASDAESTPDPRLAQPVTIECVNARLHTVVEQLSEKTGVPIRCGIDDRDWPVRDMPVTVCVKDMPLGRLLKCIAASTHLLLSKGEVGQTTIYRVWRDLKRRKQIDDFIAAFQAAEEADKRAALEWEWDAALALKDHDPGDPTPGENRHSDPNRDGIIGRELAGLLDVLGPSAREQVLSGGYIKYPPGTVPASLYPYLEPMSQDWWGLMEPGEQPLTPEDMRNCGFFVTAEEHSGAMHIDVNVSVAEAGGKVLRRTWNFNLSRAAKEASAQGLADPVKKPQVPEWQAPDGEWTDLIDAQDWELPVLGTKVSLEEPKDKNSITCGKVMAALSKASGFVIIAEDFESHRKRLSPASLFKKDTSIKDVLEHLGRESGLIWHLNEKQKIIVGTADDWPFHHKNVVSESLLVYIKAKLNGDGVDLDDFLKVAALEPGQQEEWVFPDPELAVPDAYSVPACRELWMLYDSLPAGQKAQAHTEAGLPMRNIRPAYLAYLIYRQNEILWHGNAVNALMQPSLIPYDEQSVASAVMRVTKWMTPRFGSGPGSKDGGPPGVPMVTQYKMSIYVTQNGETHNLHDNRGVKGVPIFSPEREAQLFPKPAH